MQTKIYEAARREKVPMVVLRGIKTAEHIGRHLESFGITLTKLRSLLSREIESLGLRTVVRIRRLTDSKSCLSH